MSTVALAAAQRRGTLALAGREVRRVLSLWTQTILPPVLTAVLFLAVFGGALGDRIREIEGIPYLEFILPGLLVMTVASQAFANNSTSLFQAKSEGYIEDVLTSPLRPWQLALAYTAGGLVRGFTAALAVALLAMPFAGRLERPGVAVAALLLTGLVFSLLGVITGIWAETFDQHSFVAGIVITPLALVGGVFYSARRLGEPWETLTRFDPIYYLVDATRAGMTGFHESPVWISLAVVGVVSLAAFAVMTAWVARLAPQSVTRFVGGYPGRVDLARLRGRMPLVVFILLAVVCLALLGFACACLTDQPTQAIDRASSLGSALPPLIEVWSFVFVTLMGASFLVAVRERASSRASPALLQRFLF